MLRGIVLEAREIEAFEEFEGNQRHDALPVGGNLPHINTSVSRLSEQDQEQGTSGVGCWVGSLIGSTKVES